MFYPDDNRKTMWDLGISFVLIFVCFCTPYRISFVEVETTNWTIAMYTIDLFFLLDMIIIFNTAYYQEDFKMIEDRKEIAKDYLRQWFAIDLVAILPFDLIMKLFTNEEASGGKNLNSIVRIARLGKLYKLVKLMRLIRILKILKQ
jgi:hypothetical protein